MAGSRAQVTNTELYGRITSKGGVEVDMGGLRTRLQQMASRLKDPWPALQEILALFEFMEQERFALGGEAPMFGITEHWAPITEATQQWRRTHGGNEFAPPLISSGYLARAAINPQVERLGMKGLRIEIDPRKQGAPDSNNYAGFHQTGNPGRMPARPIVTLTPEFYLQCKEIVRFYILATPSEKKSAQRQQSQSEHGFEERYFNARRRSEHRRNHGETGVKSQTSIEEQRHPHHPPKEKWQRSPLMSQHKRLEAHFGANENLKLPAHSRISHADIAENMMALMDSRQFKAVQHDAMLAFKATGDKRAYAAALQNTLHLLPEKMQAFGTDALMPYLASSMSFARKEAQRLADGLGGP